MPNPIKRTIWTVERKTRWLDDWQEVGYLDPLRCNMVCAPEVSQATFQYHFGRVKREDANQFYPFVWEEVRNKFLRIRARWTDEGDWFRLFTGIAVDNETELNNPVIQSGIQTVTAHGIEHLLDRQLIRKAWALTLNDTEPNKLDWVPTFNERHFRGLTIKGNRTKDTLSATNTHHFHNTNTDQWSNYDICKYLLYYHSPENIGFAITGQAKECLDTIFEIHDFSQDTLWTALNKLIDRRYGCGFYLNYPESSAELVEIVVFSVSDVAVNFGDVTLPANENLQPFVMPETFPGTHLVDEIPFTRTAKNQYQRIRIQGKRLKVCASFSYPDDTLREDWSDDLEQAYRVATGQSGDDDVCKANDAIRGTDRFRDVYVQHRVHPNWDGRCGDGEGGQKSLVQVTCNDDGGIDEESVAPFWNGPTPFGRFTPFQVGTRYDVSPPLVEFEQDGVDASDPEFCPIKAFIQVPFENNTCPGYGSGSGSGSGYYPTNYRWSLVDKISQVGNEDAKRNCHVSPGDRHKSVRVEVNPNHYLALNHFDGAACNTEQNEPRLDYETIIVTGMFETDQRPHILLEIAPEGEDEPEDDDMTLRELVIDVPYAEYWWVAPNTVVDVGQCGELLRYHPDNDRIIRSDKQKLELVAAYAKNWYGRERQAVRIPIKRLGLYAPLGAVITSINSVSFSEPVRTPVTGLSFDFKSETTVIETGWSALDFINATFARRLGKPASKGGR